MATSYVLALTQAPQVVGETVTLVVGVFPAGTDVFHPPVVNGTPVPYTPVTTLTVTGTLESSSLQAWQALITNSFNNWCRYNALVAQAQTSFAAASQLAVTVVDPTGN